MPAGNVTIQATFVIEVPTGVADINAAAGEPMRYFDLQGRYIGTSLDGARRGIYVTAARSSSEPCKRGLGLN